MSIVEEFIACPSKEAFEQCTKEQLLQLADYYQVEVSSSSKKEKIKGSVKSKLVEQKILVEEKLTASSFAPVSMEGLSFAERKELFMLQIEYDKYKVNATIEKDLAVEKLRQQTEQTRLDLEHQLEVIREGKSTSRPGVHLELASDPQQLSSDFDVLGNLRLVPKFSESDPDSFFLLFERVADARNWPAAARALMLQCVLTGKAQEAYSAVTAADSQDYAKVKAAVLKAYERIPEYYRQRFRSWKKGPKQSHLEFVRDLTTCFSRWCASAEVTDFESLWELVILKQFKDSVPERVAVYISEQKAKTAAEAAALADDFVLIHKHAFVEHRVPTNYIGTGMSTMLDVSSRTNRVFQSDGGGGSREAEKHCNYCHKRGHWEADCYMLKAHKTKFVPVSQVKGAGLAVPGNLTTGDSGYPVNSSCSAAMKSYLPFVRRGYVNMVGSEVKVPVNILRDTGVFDSFIQAGVLPLSKESEVGSFIPVRGMGLNVLSVPLHRVVIDCDLFQGEAALAVRPALPIEGVSLILGNKLAGTRVWPDVIPPIVAESVPQLRQDPD